MLAARNPLLTIAIPTFNRLECLKLLAEFLCSEIEEISDFGEKIEVLIANNCSTDGTTVYVNGLNRSYLIAHTHETNLGSDYNVRFCFRQARGRYVWIIGDDDLPKRGAVSFLVHVLSNNHIDLLLLRSKWINADLWTNENTRYAKVDLKYVSPRKFAKTAAVYLTFLSGMVVNKIRYQELRTLTNIDRLKDTWLPHMEWILALLREGKSFATTSGVILFARGANSGGYSVIQTFGVNFPMMVKQELGEESEMTKVIVRQLLLTWLPVWIWRVIHRSKVDSFRNDMPWGEMDKVLANHLAYRLVVKPLKYVPKWIGAALVGAGRIFKYF